MISDYLQSPEEKRRRLDTVEQNDESRRPRSRSETRNDYIDHTPIGEAHQAIIPNLLPKEQRKEIEAQTETYSQDL